MAALLCRAARRTRRNEGDKTTLPLLCYFAKCSRLVESSRVELASDLFAGSFANGRALASITLGSGAASRRARARDKTHLRARRALTQSRRRLDRFRPIWDYRAELRGGAELARYADKMLSGGALSSPAGGGAASR